MALKKFTFDLDMVDFSDLEDEARLEIYDRVFTFVRTGDIKPFYNSEAAAAFDGIVEDLAAQRSAEYLRQVRASGGLAPCGEGKRRGAPKGNQNARKNAVSAVQEGRPVKPEPQEEPPALYAAPPKPKFKTSTFFVYYNLAAFKANNPEYRQLKKLTEQQKRRLEELAEQHGANKLMQSVSAFLGGELTEIDFSFLKYDGTDDGAASEPAPRPQAKAVYSTAPFESMFNLLAKNCPNPKFKPLPTFSNEQRARVLSLLQEHGEDAMFTQIAAALGGKPTDIDFNFLKS